MRSAITGLAYIDRNQRATEPTSHRTNEPPNQRARKKGRGVCLALYFIWQIRGDGTEIVWWSFTRRHEYPKSDTSSAYTQQMGTSHSNRRAQAIRIDGHKPFEQTGTSHSNRRAQAIQTDGHRPFR
ncbi:hypothetical protein E6O75_ATG09431 [Venturia nashicola]|uniref:Uncharacterized protein n=1 Tax=Venturia nashicola TaxID=86259 RepID=A0A4Z1NKK8_9PEZI|nr:hypothetical protein E6O75_ATG09431 [Venturia nashicola]